MKSKFTPLYILLLLGSVVFINASGGPGFLVADAPGDSGTCTNCHSWGGPATVANGGIELIGAPATYVAGTTYTFKVRLTDGEATFGGGGFQLVATDGASNSMIGSFAVGADTKIPNSTSGRLTHAAPKVPVSGVVDWDVTWTAPLAGAPATVEFFFAGNASNLNMSTNGDRIYTGSTSAALPVQLAYFEAVATQAGTELRWQTANERNNDYFSIERSTDGRIFAEIAQVSGYGDSDTAIDYAFTDAALPAARVLYYRLRQMDFDGTASYSDVATVTVPNANGTWTVGPNPAPRGATLAVRGELEGELMLFNSTGQPVQRIERTRNEVTLDAALTPGVYWLYHPLTRTGERLLVQ